MIRTGELAMEIREVSRDDMLTRVARYKTLRYPADRYPDSQLPGHVRRNYLVVGKGLVVEGGNDPMSAIPIDEGFQMSYVTAEPGNGPMLHNHDTNETFVAIKGRWRVIASLPRSGSIVKGVHTNHRGYIMKSKYLLVSFVLAGLQGISFGSAFASYPSDAEASYDLPASETHAERMARSEGSAAWGVSRRECNRTIRFLSAAA